MEGVAASSVESSAGLKADSGVFCKHRVDCVVKTSRTEKNPGRRFLRCRNWKDRNVDCGFFQWVDKDTNDDESNTEIAVAADNTELKPKVLSGDDAGFQREFRNLFTELRTANDRLIVVERMLFIVIIILVGLAIAWCSGASFSV